MLRPGASGSAPKRYTEMRSVILAIVCGTRHRPRDRPPSTDVREESAAPIPDRVETESGEVDGIHCYRTAWRMGMRSVRRAGMRSGMACERISDERGPAGTVMRHDELLETHRITVEFSFTYGAKRLGTGEHCRLLVRIPCRIPARQAHAEASHTSTALNGRVAAHAASDSAGAAGRNGSAQSSSCLP
jgi:hypothetical protein